MIPVAEPNLGKLEQEYVSKAIADNWVGPDGDFVRRLEEEVAEIAMRKWCVATITGTAALRVAATVLRFKGCQIDVKEYSFPAMKNVLMELGCDISILHGDGVNHDEAVYYPQDWYYPSIADCAPALGNIGNKHTLEVYSFAANKIVTCGHGGAICGDDPDLEMAIRSAITQRQGGGRFNYRMANINAAMGCAQLKRLDEFRARKVEIWNRYQEAGLPMIDRGESRWMSTVTSIDKHRVAEDVKGFQVRVEPFDAVSIPCSTSLTNEDQDKILREFETLYK